MKLYVNKGIYDNKKIYENTLESIKSALDKKLNLYLTVRENKDHLLIVFNDNNLSRLHNIKDKIEDTTYDDLCYLSIYHIPTLNEVLNLINGQVNIILSLKIKSSNKEIINILNNYNGKYIILGKVKLINKIINKNNNILVGEILTKNSFNLFLKKIDYKSIDIKYYPKLKIKKLKEDNIPLIGYLIDNNDLLNEYIDLFDLLVVDNYKNLKIDKEL